NPLVGIIVGILFMIIGASTLYFSLGEVFSAYNSENWQNAPGKVIVSEVVRDVDSDGDISYRTDVLYQYQVEGKQFTGNTIYFGKMDNSNPGEANRIITDYPEGSEVKIYYDPDDPNISTLIPGINWEVFFLPGIFAMFFIMGFISFLMGLFYYRKQNSF
ncbi:DUF3592 domain-containing protein, partial [Candidatus Peregrinibacteria bacterium]|nr:DUF3592 domain-containing protein [Candidatus Peregrinibacteria bacterium]